MFGRSILLLSCLVLLGSTSKIHEILKKVGKRYQHEVIRDWVLDGDYAFDVRYLLWSEFPDDKKAEIKEERAQKVMDELVKVYSSDGLESIDFLTGIMNADMEAKICGGEEKIMNAEQFTEHLKQVASEYKKAEVKSKNMEIIKSDDRDALQFKIKIEHADKTDSPVSLDFFVEMDLTLGKTAKNALFTISKIHQGCD